VERIVEGFIIVIRNKGAKPRTVSAKSSEASMGRTRQYLNGGSEAGENDPPRHYDYELSLMNGSAQQPRA